jgi:membrane protease YdiL (CAAX protease family)
MPLSPYWRAAREARYSLLFALPLLALYEVLAFVLAGSAFAGVRNGADVLLKTFFVALGGRHGLAAFGLLLLGLGVALVWRDRRRHPAPLRGGYFAVMLAESVVYAMIFGGVVSTLTGLLLAPPLAAAQAPAGQITLGFGAQLVVSLGAGIYEEILFRVLLVSALVALGTALRWRRAVAVAFAVVLSALIFSAFHYVGPLGDRLELASFTFRAIAGLLLSGLYVARGFGITAWTHALYDVGLALVGQG